MKPYPSRLLYVLRRVAAGRASAVEWRVAQRLAQEGMLVIDGRRAAASRTVSVRLTPLGIATATVVVPRRR